MRDRIIAKGTTRGKANPKIFLKALLGVERKLLMGGSLLECQSGDWPYGMSRERSAKPAPDGDVLIVVPDPV